jgi:hypothetical protein
LHGVMSVLENAAAHDEEHRNQNLRVLAVQEG